MSHVAYYGRRTGPGEVTVTVCENGVDRPLVHHPRHSPDGFEWGYGGSGPADLALALLWDRIGAEPSREMYQAFKADVVARWRTDMWAMGGSAIDRWIERWTALRAE